MYTETSVLERQLLKKSKLLLKQTHDSLIEPGPRLNVESVNMKFELARSAIHRVWKTLLPSDGNVPRCQCWVQADGIVAVRCETSLVDNIDMLHEAFPHIISCIDLV